MDSDATMPLSTRLMQAAQAELNSTLESDFFQLAIQGTLAPAVVRRYEQLELLFVEDACRILGSAILHSPDGVALAGHSETLHSLTSEQFSYFADRNDRTRTEFVGTRSRAKAEPLMRYVQQIAHEGNYGEVIVCMLPSEILYESWCTEAVVHESLNSELREWVELHTRPPYTERVDFLRRETDAFGNDIDLERCVQIVTTVLRLEEAFHAAAFIED